MKIEKESLDYLNGHMKVTDEIENKILKHCKKYDIKPEICAWYENMEDFYSDWCDKNTTGLTKEEARERYSEGKQEGEFLKFANGNIIRFVI